MGVLCPLKIHEVFLIGLLYYMWADNYYEADLTKILNSRIVFYLLEIQPDKESFPLQHGGAIAQFTSRN